MSYFREKHPTTEFGIEEDSFFRRLYDLINRLGLPPDDTDYELPPPVNPRRRPPPLPFDVSQIYQLQSQHPAIVDPRRPPPRRRPPPPKFNVSERNQPQRPAIVDPRRTQSSPGMLSPEMARSVDLVRQAMLMGGFNRNALTNPRTNLNEIDNPFANEVQQRPAVSNNAGMISGLGDMRERIFQSLGMLGKK